MHLSWKRIHLHTRETFRIARPGASVQGRDLTRVIVRLEHAGVVGLGEAVPVPYYNQSVESIERVLQAAADLLEPVEPIEATVDRLIERFDDQRAAVAALDGALHDWLGKRQGTPVWSMLGVDPGRVPPTSMTIALAEPEQMAGRVRAARDFPILKIKVGTPGDEAVLEAVRREAPDKRLRLDANGGWSADEAADRIRALLRFEPELIEQPLPAGSLTDLKRLRETFAGNPPIIADEDCVRPADTDRLAGVVDGVNVKLSKCGGIVEARRTIERARQCGLSVMLGCMVETSLGIAAAAQLAALADYVDLDGHLLLADDPFEGLALDGAAVRPSTEPGLGIRVRGVTEGEADG